MVDRFVVLTSSAHMPNSVRSAYRNVAVIETDGINMPRRINKRDKAVVRIVALWERQHMGRNPRGNTAYEVALREAFAMAARLNTQQVEA